jgi:beta-N-acetylhexosaminidase
MPTSLPAAVQTVLDAVHSGRLSEARIDQSVRRILKMKTQLGLFSNPYVSPTPTVGTPEHLQTMADIAKRSITVLRNSGPVPLPIGKNVLVTGWGVSTTQNLTNQLTSRGITATRFYTGSPSAAVIAQAVAAAQAADVTVVTTYNAWGDTTQQNLLAALLATGKPIVVASVGGPYDIAYFPSAPTYLAAYDYQPVSVVALADALTGAAKATGHLPVTIRTPDGSQVLFPFGS